MQSINVPFHLRESSGEIGVQIQSGWELAEADASTSALSGAAQWALSFPTCTATLAHPARGYDAMCGWIQLVKSTDGGSPDVYEMDPLPFTSDIDLPYCWFGTMPTLFDGPTRESRQDLVWRSHSFLCASPNGLDRRVEFLAGFSWGFDVLDGEISFVAPARLAVEDWRTHFPVFEETYPRWSFLAGRAAAGTAT